ncbi:uncharacterized protein LOC121627436 isoform X1 [Chelmon rostratus]|uniref:uncharacterized protein LOC121627436 isoform X1 n=1 Tax=Chelmon rostratus TaxID=109905 RepID=UPI001BEA6D24|nr:uncharacterized protein LOC121627436 isoform X1 [Chelmon rostratus]
MAKWKLCFVLLLPLTVCLCKQETLVKKAGSKSAVTPLCTNSIDTIITLIVCKVSKERSREECRLMYRHGDDFKNECESRFTLTKVNQTVFLQLSSLTPEDSGNYTCECSHPDGTDILSLSITVEDDVSRAMLHHNNKMTTFLIAVPTTIIIIGVIVGLIYRTKSNGGCSRSATSGLSVCEAPGSLDQDDPDDPYTSLQHPESDLYQTVTNSASKKVTVRLDNLEIGEGESDASCTAYENI